MEKIEKDGLLLGVILYAAYSRSEGIEFITEETSEFQMGYMVRPKNYEVKPHRHLKQSRVINNTSEVLIIKSGLIRVSFYDLQDKFVVSKELTSGDICMLLNGGHAVKFLDHSEVIEIKQGPHCQHKDKEFI